MLEISDSIQETIVSYYEGRLTQNQADELLAWIHQDDEKLHLFRQIGELWYASGKLSSHEYNSKKALASVSVKINERGIRRLPAREIRIKVSTLIRIAAGFLLLTTMGIAGMLIFNKSDEVITSGPFVETFSPKGSRSTITLADGTQVWLNAGTRFRYPVDYGTTNRIVYLEGEAYFKVSKNRKLPFRVNTSDISVTALGTSFNVKAYKDEEIIETTLEEGRVRVEALKGQKSNGTIDPVVLRPNQNVVFHKRVSELTVSEKESQSKEVKDPSTEKLSTIPMKVITVSDTRLYTSWKDSRWIFKNEKLSTLAPKLERRYDINIVFADSVLLDYAFTGNLEEESIEQVMQVISYSAPVRFEVDFKQVTLFVDKQRKDDSRNSKLP